MVKKICFKFSQIINKYQNFLRNHKICKYNRYVLINHKYSSKWILVQRNITISVTIIFHYFFRSVVAIILIIPIWQYVVIEKGPRYAKSSGSMYHLSMISVHIFILFVSNIEKIMLKIRNLKYGCDDSLIFIRSMATNIFQV